MIRQWLSLIIIRYMYNVFKLHWQIFYKIIYHNDSISFCGSDHPLITYKFLFFKYSIIENFHKITRFKHLKKNKKSESNNASIFCFIQSCIIIVDKIHKFTQIHQQFRCRNLQDCADNKKGHLTFLIITSLPHWTTTMVLSSPCDESAAGDFFTRDLGRSNSSWMQRCWGWHNSWHMFRKRARVSPWPLS